MCWVSCVLASIYNLSSSKDALLEKGRASGIFLDQILSLLEILDGSCMFELFDCETNLGKKHSVFMCPV